MPRLCQYSALYFSASDVMSFLGRKLTGHFQGEVVTDQREVEVRGTRVPGRRVRRQGRDVMAWVPLRKSVTLLFRYRELLAGEHALHGFTNRDVRQKLGRTSYPLAPNEDRQPSQVTRLFRRLHAHGLIAKIPRSRRWRVSLAGRRTMSTAIKLREVAYPALFAAAAWGHRNIFVKNEESTNEESTRLHGGAFARGPSTAEHGRVDGAEGAALRFRQPRLPSRSGLRP